MLPRFLEIIEWLPLVALPFVAWAWTEGFTRPLDLDLWLVLGLAALVNGAWIVFHRHVRLMAEFPKKFPGFRMKKDG